MTQLKARIYDCAERNRRRDTGHKETMNGEAIHLNNNPRPSLIRCCLDAEENLHSFALRWLRTALKLFARPPNSHPLGIPRYHASDKRTATYRERSIHVNLDKLRIGRDPNSRYRTWGGG